MDRRIWLLIIVWHLMMSCVCARNMHFAPSHGILHQGHNLQPPRTPIHMQEGFGSREKEEKVVRRVGSSPPRCEHKCTGCTPCSPIQVVPSVHFDPQYANYEPQGWKCKCGSVFYNP